jgi:transcriptional regulator
MTAEDRRFRAEKADRALDLHDKGLPAAQIAERLGVRPANIAGMLQRARQRREKAEAQA